MSLIRRALAECAGTFWLVLGGCGSAVLAAGVPVSGIGYLGVSLAFGLSVLAMASAIGPLSGGHMNPAVTVGLWAGGRFEGRDVPAYVLGQVAGAILAACVLFAVASGRPGFVIGAFASNGYGAASPGGYGFGAVLLCELVMTAVFLFVIMAVTDVRASSALAPVAIGMTLALIHLASIPVSNTSVNPARSTGPALIAGGLYLQQLWLFWLAPLAGGVLGARLYRMLRPG